MNVNFATVNLAAARKAPMTTQRRWLRTLVGFVIVASLLEISVVIDDDRAPREGETAAWMCSPR